jgi:SNW domain-containing protein 1
MGADTKAKYLAKTTERDISEKIALGLAKPTASRESMFDSRLFNQTEGLNSGFKGDDAYDLYDKPLFANRSAVNIYRPQKKAEGDQYMGSTEADLAELVGTKRFGIGSKGFKGTETDTVRDGPVQFEKQVDPFGVDQFLSQAKLGKRSADDHVAVDKRHRG